MTVYLVSADLMDRSKVAGIADGVALVLIRTASALVDRAGELIADDRVLLDLGGRGALDAIETLTGTGATVIGYGSHVDEKLLAAARERGCADVLARSVFFRRLPELLAGGPPRDAG